MSLGTILADLLAGHEKRTRILPKTIEVASKYRRDFLDKTGPSREAAERKLARYLDGERLDTIKNAWTIAFVFNARLIDRNDESLMDSPKSVIFFWIG